MPIELNEFYQQLFQDVIAAADANERYIEDSFFDYFTENLIEAGELETADRVFFSSPRGLRVDGYGGDPQGAEGVLSLIVLDFNQSPAISTLTAAEMDAAFKRVFNFLTKSLDRSFRDSLEETGPAFGLADLIAQRWSDTSKVRLFLLSNRVLSARVDSRPAGDVQGVPVTYTVWDLGRLHRFESSGQAREDLLVDLADFGGPLQALPAHLNEAGYEAYLVVIPGRQLAAIYDRWGPRLLEQNVRVFLQARGNVNKGIRNTIENDPNMFFAYNNGVTATAEAITTSHNGDGLFLTGLRNFQIVNGGQTTASIHAASKKKDVDLSKVFVQMKLSIVASDRAPEVVPRISEYANSQNRVSAADFFANHPFHWRMQEFSRRIYAPSPDGSFRQSKWFYERARGQYQDARGLLSAADRRKFDLEYPRSQVITKTDLAKYLNSWRGEPHIVSRGSQKNFAEFARAIGREWDSNADMFNEQFFRQSVAQAIAFRDTEKLVSNQPWYQGGGVRSRVVPYAIAKLAHEAKKHSRVIDFDRIWRDQALPNDITAALAVAAEAVHDVIVNAGPENPNPLEWAKQPACWSRVQARVIEWPEGWLNSQLTEAQVKVNRREGIKDQRVLNGIEAQTIVFTAGGPFWKQVLSWATDRRLVTEKEASILAVAATIPKEIPSEKQSVVVIETLRRLHGEGLALGRELVASVPASKQP